MKKRKINSHIKPPLHLSDPVYPDPDAVFARDVHDEWDDAPTAPAQGLGTAVCRGAGLEHFPPAAGDVYSGAVGCEGLCHHWMYFSLMISQESSTGGICEKACGEECPSGGVILY